MTNTTTIIAIAIGLLLFLIIKKFYYSITNKEIEKEKKIDKNHWLKARQEQLAATINRIEAENKGETYNLSVIKK